jgi:hypothetical protein
VRWKGAPNVDAKGERYGGRGELGVGFGWL